MFIMSKITTRQTQKHLHEVVKLQTYTVDGESHNNHVCQKKEKFTAVINRP